MCVAVNKTRAQHLGAHEDKAGRLYSLLRNACKILIGKPEGKDASWKSEVKIKKVKLSLSQTLKAHRVVRRRGSHIFSRQSAHKWLWRCLHYAAAALYSWGRVLVLVSVRGWVDTRAIVRLEGLGKLKKSNDLIGNRTRDLLACSIVLQPTMLPRGPEDGRTYVYRS
jgi:hypothetical protein